MSDREEYNSPEYKAWRYHVLCRDKFTCEMCKSKGGQLNAHHIQKWSKIPQLRYVVSNGITLCTTCHAVVTGKEEQFEEQFKKAIAIKKIAQQTERGITPTNKGLKNIYGPWKPRNLRLRY